MSVLKRTFIIIFLVFSVVLSAQKQKPKNVSTYDDKPLHFGFSMGINTMDYNIKPSSIAYKTDSLFPEITSLKPGINIQVVIDYRPLKYFDVRFLPGVSFGQRNINFYKNGTLINDQQVLESSFLEFPLIFKTKGTRLNNTRPFLLGGLNFRYDLAGKKEYDEEKPVYLRVHRGDLYYEVGAGIDFYLTFFKLTVEAKMSNGIRDVLVHEPAPGYPQYCNAIESMRSQMWVLAFHFE